MKKLQNKGIRGFPQPAGQALRGLLESGSTTFSTVTAVLLHSDIIIAPTMSQAFIEPAPARAMPPKPHPARGKWLLVTVLTLLGVLAVGFVGLLIRWPFTPQEVAKNLEEATGSKVQIATFQKIFLPFPGCVAGGLTFRHGSDSKLPPVMTIERLHIRSSFFGLFGKHITKIVADGVHVVLPPLGSETGAKPASDIVVGELVAKNAVIEFSRKSSSDPRIEFLARRLSFKNLGRRTKITFYAAVRTPEPPGEAEVNGTLGPFKEGENPEAPIDGSYTFTSADLGKFPGIAGILASTGKFQGKLNHMEVEGQTDTPDFEVRESNHRVHLTTNFKALVNATNGDVELHGVDAHFLKSAVLTRGEIEGKSDQAPGKTASLDMFVREGRIQDLMMVFIKAPHSPLKGTVSLHAHAVLPPGKEPFLKKLRMEGDFGIDAARFTNAQTQQSIGTLSESARGKPPDDDDKEKNAAEAENLLSDLKGHVVLQNGIATFTRLSFAVPGAHAEMHGTYDLISEKIDLAGVLQMQAKLSDATTGIKSFLVKALSPFLKNNRPREPLPVTITGTYDHPSYHVASTPKK